MKLSPHRFDYEQEMKWKDQTRQRNDAIALHLHCVFQSFVWEGQAQRWKDSKWESLLVLVDTSCNARTDRKDDQTEQDVIN